MQHFHTEKFKTPQPTWFFRDYFSGNVWGLTDEERDALMKDGCVDARGLIVYLVYPMLVPS